MKTNKIFEALYWMGDRPIFWPALYLILAGVFFVYVIAALVYTILFNRGDFD